MKKRLTSAVLVLAMVLTLFSGLTLTASAETIVGTFVLATSFDDINDGTQFIILGVRDSGFSVFDAANSWGYASSSDYDTLPETITNPKDSCVFTISSGVTNTSSHQCYILRSNNGKYVSSGGSFSNTEPNKATTQFYITKSTINEKACFDFQKGDETNGHLGVRSDSSNNNKWGIVGYAKLYSQYLYIYVLSSTPPAPAYTITAATNNESYGTVSLTGSVITATPEDGYRVSTTTPYTVTSGTATVSQSGNTFTVTPSTDCTVQINFEAIPTHNVTVTASNGTVAGAGTYAEGATVTLTPGPAGVYGFSHWSSASGISIDGIETNNPLIFTMGDSDVSITANFAVVYTKTTAIHNNDYIIIQNPANSVALGSEAKDTNFLSYVDAIPEGSLLAAPEGVAIMVVETDEDGYYSFRLKDTNLYLTNTESNYLKFSEASGNNSKWTLDEQTFSGVKGYYIKNVAANTRKIQYYASNSCFTAYTTTGNAYNMHLYKLTKYNGARVAIGAKDPSSDITLNFYFSIPTESSVSKVLLDGTPFAITDLALTNDGYKVPVPVNAKNYDDNHTVQLVDDSNNVISFFDTDGSVVTSISTSISDYISYVKSYDKDDAYDAAKPVVEALEDYCRLAQAALGDTPETVPTSLNNDADLAAIHPDTDWAGWTDDYEKPTNEITLADGTTKIKYYGATLVLEDKVTVRFYFSVTGGGDAAAIVGANTCTFTCVDQNSDERDVSIKAITKGNMIALNVTGIRAVDLDDLFTVGLTANSTTITVPSYGPFTYGARMFGKESTSASMKKLIQALKLYNEAAEAYFTPAP